MKKLIAVLVTIIMIFSVSPAVFGSGAGKYKVTALVTEVYFSPSFSAEKIAELTKNTFVNVTQTKDGFGRAYIAKDGVWGWVPLEDMSFVNETAVQTDITGIEITSLPKKLTYTDSWEELDLTGLSVVSINKNGVRKSVTSYSVFAPQMKLYGDKEETKTIKIVYSPDKKTDFSTEFTVKVIRQPVKEITVVTPPKYKYLENQQLDLSELKVKLVFTDTTPEKTYTYAEIKDNPDFTVKGCHSEDQGSILSHGIHSFDVKYKYSDISCTFSVDVTPRKLTSLEIIRLPDNLTVYDNTKVPPLDGLVLNAHYDNGDIEQVQHYNCTTDFDPSSFVIGTDNNVNIYFGGLYVTVKFTYSVALPKQIVPEYPQGFTFRFYKGEEIDLSGIRVRLVYTDDSYEYVKDFTISKPDYTKIDSTQNIVIRYNEFSEVFSIMITSFYSKGDVDNDGKITANDARQALRASVALTTLKGQAFFAGDADRDNKITAGDARLILRASVKLENLYVVL